MVVLTILAVTKTTLALSQLATLSNFLTICTLETFILRTLVHKHTQLYPYILNPHIFDPHNYIPIF